MKIEKVLFYLSLIVGLTLLMSTTCEKDDSNDPAGTCDGYVSATTSGELNATLCFDVLVSYEYSSGESLSFVTRQDGEPIYSCTIQMSSGNGTFNGPGTYQCGFDEPGYLELDIHGVENEFYKAQSGTITITQLDESHFNATFNVVTVGYYNEKTVTIVGTAKI